MSDMLSKEVSVVNEFGIHSRPAAMIAAIADDAVSSVWLSRKGGERVDASSIIDILTCECPKGSSVVVEVEDLRDNEVLYRISDLIAKGFKE